MYSRRSFLMKVILFTPFVLFPVGLLNRIPGSYYTKKEKFIKQGWLLQEGDV